MAGGEVALVIKSKYKVYSLSFVKKRFVSVSSTMGGMNWRTLPGGSGPSAIFMWFGRQNRESCSMIIWQARQQLGGKRERPCEGTGKHRRKVWDK